MSEPSPRVVDFGGLSIGFDERVLEPREWTQAQSRWAAELLADAAPGPVLELCAGAGQIGLLAVRGSTRSLVCVDADVWAVEHLRRNASAAGMAERVEVRHAPLEEAVRAGEEFALVLADPPWVPTRDVATFPDDPTSAIDGGAEGLDVARACLRVTGRHLAAGGSAVLQLGSAAQVDALGEVIEDSGLEHLETRAFGSRGVLTHLRRVDPSR